MDRQSIKEGRQQENPAARGKRARQRNTGLAAFLISGVSAISSGVIVSLLQENLGFSYGITGLLLALMNTGNLLAGFATGILPEKIGMKRTMMFLTGGYALGYGIATFSGWVALLAAAFFLMGVGKGSVINFCTILVGNNSDNRTKGMNIMHGCYALGALLCPFLVAWAAALHARLPMALLSGLGILLWGLFMVLPTEESNKGRSKKETDRSFLKSRKFWILTGLIFCQNAVEISVTGWMVTYFKGSGILSGVFSAYTVTVMWTATLLVRLFIAFVFPIRNSGAAMVRMAAGCTAFYFALVMAKGSVGAIGLLFLFAAAMAGMNPTAVAAAGSMTSVASMGIMLPAASSGAILMPWVIGMVAERAGIGAGMACNLVPCTGMLILSWMLKRMPQE